MSLWTALTRNRAETAPDAADPEMRGRSYALPFDEVWHAALSLARTAPLWEVTGVNARRGTILVEARTRVWGFVDDVQIRLSLDRNGLTRVDLVSRSRTGRGDFGVNARRIRRFLRHLDRALSVR